MLATFIWWPLVELVKLMFVAAPLQITGALLVAVKEGLGLTTIVNTCDVPGHTPNEGVTVIVAVTGPFPELIPVKAAMLPVPLAGKPIAGVSLDQLNVAPAVPVNVIAETELPAHIS
jgi:hypothetical protein